MTEAEWLNATDPEPMLEFLRGKASDRKLHLLVVACCYRIWRLLPVACQNLCDVLERFADGLVTAAEYQAVWGRADAQALAADRDPPNALTYATASVGVSNPPTVPSISSCLDTAASAVACAAAEKAPDDDYDTTHDASRTQEMFEQVRLVLDLFGNPFRPITLDATWLRPKVVRLAQAIYDERVFDRLPSLADALEEAGCTDADILCHCRGPGPHARGCWAVDLLLGKE